MGSASESASLTGSVAAGTTVRGISGMVAVDQGRRIRE
jgi:hypothetical protein